MAASKHIQKLYLLVVLLISLSLTGFAQQRKGRERQKNSVSVADAFIKAIPSKSSVHLSDTLTITYRLYTTVDINKVVEANFPYTRDFYTANMANLRQDVKEETINNSVYKVIDLRTIVLQPKSIGRKTIPEGNITIEYAIPTGRKVQDAWGNVYNEVERKLEILPIDSVTIDVHDMIAL